MDLRKGCRPGIGIPLVEGTGLIGDVVTGEGETGDALGYPKPSKIGELSASMAVGLTGGLDGVDGAEC